MNNKFDTDFANFLSSMSHLDVLHSLTNNLDNELKDSQTVMNEIKGMIDALPSTYGNLETEATSNELRHEDISNFLAAGTPNLLLPDMEVSGDLNLDDVIATMKSYVEDIKKNYPSVPEAQFSQTKENVTQLKSLDLEQYASSLDDLSKRLSHMKLGANVQQNSGNTEIEAKLSLLCDDVNTFTKMIQYKTSLNGANQNWPEAPQNTNALEYENLINKLLIEIDGVSCLLRSRH